MQFSHLTPSDNPPNDSTAHVSDNIRHSRNRLANESSPYLLSHADNPVDWYPWGEEAFARARTENKPIFLSIGYAACHWCHVMERESFENEEIAAFLNKRFVSIKVDREQRPDIDQIYMAAVQAFTHGGGGWPMSVFLTPDRKPFFAGTYFPPQDKVRYEMPGFLTVLRGIDRVFRESPDSVTTQAGMLTEAIQRQLAPAIEKAEIAPDLFAIAVRESERAIDAVYGGWGDSRKFPHTAELAALVRHWSFTRDDTTRNHLIRTLDAMLAGGLYDQIGGGFHRYTVDRQWSVPHFEKMLYDNALLVSVYADAYLLLGDERYRITVIETLDFLLREMRDVSGGFYSALDADSEGEEGKYYVWTYDEIRTALGDDATLIFDFYNVGKVGNFEGNATVLSRNGAAFSRLAEEPKGELVIERLRAAREQLRRVRDQRPRPATDDKALAAWNGMTLSALCRGYQITGDTRYREASIALGRFLSETMWRADELRHSYCRGHWSSGQFLEDYAYVAYGMLDLYEITFDRRWSDYARQLARRAFDLFADADGALYLTPDAQADLLARPSDIYDGSYPSAGAYLIMAAQKLGAIYEDSTLAEWAQVALRTLGGAMERIPRGLMASVIAANNEIIPRVEVVIVGELEAREPFVTHAWRTYAPFRVLIAGIGAGASGGANNSFPLLRDRNPGPAGVTAFVCRNRVCKAPTSALEDFKTQLERAMQIRE